VGLKEGWHNARWLIAPHSTKEESLMIDLYTAPTKERPACRRGVEAPFKLDSLVNDEKAAQQFAENARKSLQR